jgi:hypothetical protein
LRDVIKEEALMTEVRFEIEGQAAAEITNVGGDVYNMSEARRRGAAVGRGLALAGLLVGLAGLGSLILAGVKTGQVLPPDDWAAYEDYVAMTWAVAGVILVVAGIVVGKIGRVLASR